MQNKSSRLFQKGNDVFLFFFKKRYFEATAGFSSVDKNHTYILKSVALSICVETP